GQAGWSSGSTQQPTNFDRYNQSTSAASISQRTQTAVTDTGNSLRDGMEAGIRAGEQSLGVNGTQTQSTYTNRGGTTSPWPAASTAGTSAPAWPSTSNTANTQSQLGTAPVTSAPGGWSTIGTGIPAPKLLIPQSPMTNSGGQSNETAFGTT